MSFELPKLNFAYDALEPYIDAKTMEIHHSKHHGGYTTKLNGAIEGTDLAGKSIENILSDVSKASAAVRNNGGGFYNHVLFWEVMSPKGGGEPNDKLMDAIKKKFGSFRNILRQIGKGGDRHDRRLLCGKFHRPHSFAENRHRRA